VHNDKTEKLLAESRKDIESHISEFKKQSEINIEQGIVY